MAQPEAADIPGLVKVRFLVTVFGPDRDLFVDALATALVVRARRRGFPSSVRTYIVHRDPGFFIITQSVVVGVADGTFLQFSFNWYDQDRELSLPPTRNKVRASVILARGLNLPDRRRLGGEVVATLCPTTRTLIVEPKADPDAVLRSVLRVAERWELL